MDDLLLTSRVDRIQPFEEGEELEGGRVGLVDVILHVRRKLSDEVIGVAEVRIYYTDPSITIAQINTEARHRATEICRQISELASAEPPIAGLDQRWG
jgi:hypothetical protein